MGTGAAAFRPKGGCCLLNRDYHWPPNYTNVCRAVEELKSRHPALKVFPIGKSVLERRIQALCIGNPAGATLFVGATHGSEWLTALLLLRFCGELLKALETGARVSDIDVRRAMRNRSLVVVPCLNPDGVEIALEGPGSAGERAAFIESLCVDGHRTWQANANGVDLNHNFDAGWCILKEMEQEAGITGPAPTRYGGPHAQSEAETGAIVTFCMTYQPRTLYSMHAQGEEIYYRYGDRTPARSQLMAQILSSSSGYALSSPEGLASHGGLKDWFIEKLRRPGFTIEVGRGKNPLGLEKLDKIYAKIEEMLIIATLL